VRVNAETQAFDRYSRYEQQVADGLTQMFVSGTSTHKVGEVAQTLLGVAPSASSVSRLNQTLTEQFEAWRERPLLARYRRVVPGWRSLQGSSWLPDRFHDHFNRPGCGSGWQQGGMSLARLCRGR
jgi:hypothetical protein